MIEKGRHLGDGEPLDGAKNPLFAERALSELAGASVTA